MITTYVGLVDGMHTWEVRDERGEVVGFNQSPFPLRPDGDGWVLDEAACEWVQAPTCSAQ